MSNPCCPPPEGARDPAFLQALDPAATAALVTGNLLAEGRLVALAPEYVRWKERDGSLVGYRAIVRTAEGDHATWVTVRTAAPARLADEAERLLHRADETYAGLRAFAFVPAANVLLLALPLDRAMSDLRRVLRASKVRGLVQDTCGTLVPPGQRISKSRSRGRLCRYKPERRAVLHWELGLVADGGGDDGVVTLPLWVRCFAEAQAHRTTAATAAAAAAGVRGPRTLAVAHDRLLVESHVEGAAWLPFTPRTEAADAGVAAAARAVAQLHEAPLPTLLHSHGPLLELDHVLGAAEDLERLSPRLGALAASIAQRLTSMVPAASAPVLAHGDLHPGQVLLGRDDAALCDFDRACLAPPAHDLATLHAHCLGVDPSVGAALSAAFRREYSRHHVLAPAAEQGWWNAAALVRAATTPFRALRPDWPNAAARLLDLALHELRTHCAEASL